jgi:hypothetical protein
MYLSAPRRIETADADIRPKTEAFFIPDMDARDLTERFIN